LTTQKNPAFKTAPKQVFYSASTQRYQFKNGGNVSIMSNCRENSTLGDKLWPPAADTATAQGVANRA
jgi:hypothetical protein